MNIEGAIKMIGDTQSFGTNGFQKREIVITTLEQYPQHILCEFIQDKCALLDNFKVGQNVKLSINLRGREWVNPEGETKYFNTIQAWRIEFSTNQNNPQTDPIPAEPQNSEPEHISGEDEDDLPF